MVDGYGGAPCADLRPMNVVEGGIQEAVRRHTS